MGDELNLSLPPWIERVENYARDMCVFGATCEPHELVWRIMSSKNVLLKMAEDSERFAKVTDPDWGQTHFLLASGCCPGRLGCPGATE